MPSAPSITFEIRPSRTLAGAAGLVLVGGMVGVLLADFPWWIGLPCCLAAALGGMWALRQYIYPPYVRASVRDGEWTLVGREGRSYGAEVRGHRRMGAFVQVEFDVEGSGFAHLLVHDNCDVDTRRRLLLVLAHGSATAPGHTAA